MAKIRGGHSFKPRVQPFSSPLADAIAAPGSVVAPTAGQSTPPAAADVASHALVPAAPAPRRYDTRVGPTPPSPPHLWPSRRAPLQRGPGLRASASHPVRGPRSPIPHLFRDQLMTYPQIYLLLLLSDVPSFIAAPLQAIQIAVPRKCTTKHIMIFQLLLSILRSEIP